MANPFHASFGVSPPLLVGRDDVLDEFVEALEDGPGSSGRATLYTGARGAGKTVMLNAIEDRARERDWLIISETAQRPASPTASRSSICRGYCGLLIPTP